jgi:cholesterol transport system auxiliary component
VKLIVPRLCVVAVFGLLVTACASSAPPSTFDLTAPREKPSGGLSGQLVIPEPVAVQPLDGERIIVRDPIGAVSFIGGGQWADRLPRLVQAKMIQAFENASRIRAVSRPGDRVTADYQLNSEIRAFQLDSGTGEAFVELSAKIVSDRTGRIGAARVFSARVPISGSEAGAVAQGLDQALSRVLLDIVRWSGSGR